jgi:hypothetical protein
MQGWYDPREQALLSEELATRAVELTETERLDLKPFMAKLPQAGGEFGIIDQPQTTGPTEPVVVELGDLAFSLDDLEQLDAAPAPLDDLPAWAREFAAATELTSSRSPTSSSSRPTIMTMPPAMMMMRSPSR